MSILVVLHSFKSGEKRPGLKGPFLCGLFFLVLIPLCFEVCAQQHKKQAKNLVGVTGIFDISNLSSAAGIEYERDIFRTNRFIFGARADYFLPYKSENSFLAAFNLSGGNYSVFGSNYKISVMQVWGTASYFTSARRTNNGFFLSSAIGLTHSSAKQASPSTIGKPGYSNVFGGFELGIGSRFLLSGKVDGRIMGSVSLSHPQRGMFGESELLLLGLKASIGF